MDKEIRYRRLFVAVSLFIVISFLIYDIIFGKMGLFVLRDLKDKYSMQESKVKVYDRELKSMEIEVKELKGNLDYIEEIARKDLGLVNDKERIIILEDMAEKGEAGAGGE